MSGWLMMRDSVGSYASPQGIKTPMFWGHGSSDRVVHFAVQDPGVEALEKLGCKVKKAVYPGVAHSLGGNSVQDFAQFFHSRSKGEL
jgi:predicted esterase